MDRSEAGKKGYEKTGHILREKAAQKSRQTRDTYEADPKICPTCEEVIPFEKRRNKFCSHSCAAKHNNLGVVRVKTVHPKTCANCGVVKEKRHNKYCDSCIEDNVYSNKIEETHLARKDITRKKIILEKRGHQCEVCGLTSWLDQQIPLELDHVDGDPDNNYEDNLRLICPNCHALTDTYKGANSGNSSRQKMRRERYKNSQTY